MSRVSKKTLFFSVALQHACARGYVANRLFALFTGSQELPGGVIETSSFFCLRALGDRFDRRSL